MNTKFLERLNSKNEKDSDLTEFECHEFSKTLISELPLNKPFKVDCSEVFDKLSVNSAIQCFNEITLERINANFLKVTPVDIHDFEYFLTIERGDEIFAALSISEHVRELHALILEKTEQPKGTHFNIESEEEFIGYSMVFSGKVIKDVIKKVLSFYGELNKRTTRTFKQYAKIYTIKDGKCLGKK
jgi:hypothetical protein